MLTFHEFTADNFQNIGKIQDFVFERGGGLLFYLCTTKLQWQITKYELHVLCCIPILTFLNWMLMKPVSAQLFILCKCFNDVNDYIKGILALNMYNFTNIFKLSQWGKSYYFVETKICWRNLKLDN